MRKRRRGLWAFLIVAVCAIAVVVKFQDIKGLLQEPGTSSNAEQTPANNQAADSGSDSNSAAPPDANSGTGDTGPDTAGQQNTNPSPPAQQEGGGDSDGDGAMHVVAQPDSITALVNKQNELPDNYEPPDLVYPDVRFIFKEKIDKRKMRKVAATALEQLFAGAKKDGIYLAGVSAYRSYATQKAVFENYVKRDGEAKARTYSALPGTSEHETGLAIDVSGSDGKCAATDCFGGTPEAEWLAKHASEYGFIIRYPKGKEKITGYKYEPWHIRYVGKDIAQVIAEKGLTLEEYYEQYGKPDDGSQQVVADASGDGQKP
ncbi:M15 family metallopeptidase [Paenibacillus humicola]|uniref:M15 family metallopeptidase n=1 Tax=Paenibacillus humicola TaxID=3110540 RepID=UPI00237A55AE|nr:M15 family metallopeptidase [Paenibacillus humicola]